MSITIHVLDAASAITAIPALSDILSDCVHNGASVSFMLPFPRAEAEAFWRGVAEGVALKNRILLVAQDGDNILGTVQVMFAPQPNQPHRADISKMLVHSSVRRQGVGEALMRAAEDAARGAGKTVLVLDTVTGTPAYRLYERLGWNVVGEVPDFALYPDGTLCPTTFFHKTLA
jgi:ribosomal protein S18 acetylase RimI-like enzyme